MTLSIIIPAYNEEENIGKILENIERSLSIAHELVVINDHSTDNTRGIIIELSKRYSNIRLVDNNGQKGFANAVKTGFKNAKGEVVIPIMADLCDDLATIEKMMGKINEGYDIVCGSRYIKGGLRLGGSRIKGFFSSFAGWSLHYLLGLPTHDIANAFKMYRKIVIEAVDIKSTGFEISMEIPLKAYYLGFKITEVPTIWKEREKGKSSFKMFRLFPNYSKIYLWGIFKRITPAPKPWCGGK